MPYRERLDNFLEAVSPADKQRRSLKFDLVYPVRHSLTALGSGRAGGNKAVQLS